MSVFRQLRPFYAPYRLTLVLGIASMALLTAVGLLRPFLIQQLIDRVIHAGRYDLLPLLSAAVIGVALLRGVFNFGRQYFGELFGQNTVLELRNALYVRLQYLAFGYYDKAQTGNLMSRLTGDVEAFRMFLSFGIIFLCDIGFMIGFGLVAMLAISPKLTLVTFAVSPYLAYVCWRFDRQIRPTFSRIRKALSDLTTTIQETISGVRTVKSFAREVHEIDKFQGRNQDYRDRHLDAANLWARYFPLLELGGNLATALLLWYGGRLVVTGALSLGSLVAFFSLVGYMVWPIRELGWMLNLYSQSVAAGARLVEVLHAPETVADREGAVALGRARGHVRFERVSFAYDGRNPVLEGIDLDAPPGSTIALIGTTGSGKSSLVSLIPRFYDVTRGRVTVDGHDVRDLELASLRRNVGFVLQETFLFSATVRENIAYGRPEASLDEIMAAARRAQAHEFIMAMPQGYDTVVGERGLGLSGGQKQRIAIARALLVDPPILILDDATSSVDMETEERIQEALAEVMRGRTTFVIAHRVSTLQRADEILVLDQGRIVERGRHHELLRRGGFYRRVYDIQFRDVEAGGDGWPRAVPALRPAGEGTAG
ncbi:MAG TPA: ABC transporter ATP-binding protein [Bacillota bacterium]